MLSTDFLPEDLTRDNVARRKLGEAVLLEHEALPFFVDQNRTFATNCPRKEWMCMTVVASM